MLISRNKKFRLNFKKLVSKILLEETKNYETLKKLTEFIWIILICQIETYNSLILLSFQNSQIRWQSGFRIPFVLYFLQQSNKDQSGMCMIESFDCFKYFTTFSMESSMASEGMVLVANGIQFLSTCSC